MSEGFVYILSNEYMPGVVKIGRTSRSVSGRASELYKTGVPAPFKIEHEVLSPDCRELEGWVHELFAARRISGDREFFAVEVIEAITCLDDQLVEQIKGFVDRYAENLVVMSQFLQPPEESVFDLGCELGARDYEIMGALSEITPDEIGPAVTRYRERRERTLAAIKDVSERMK